MSEWQPGDPVHPREDDLAALLNDMYADQDEAVRKVQALAGPKSATELFNCGHALGRADALGKWLPVLRGLAREQAARDA